MRRSHTVNVQAGEYAAIPNTTIHVLMGPGKLQLTRYADGKIEGLIIEGHSGSAELAVKRQLKRVSWEI
jgi:hypothetical protein